MPLINLCYCNNKKLHRNSTGRPVEYKWSLHQQRVASSENETSESPRDNFSTSKPVDMFDSNLSQLRGVDGVHPNPPIPSNSSYERSGQSQRNRVFHWKILPIMAVVPKNLVHHCVRRWKYEFWNVPHDLDMIMTTNLLSIDYYLGDRIFLNLLCLNKLQQIS